MGMDFRSTLANFLATLFLPVSISTHDDLEDSATSDLEFSSLTIDLFYEPKYLSWHR